MATRIVSALIMAIVVIFGIFSLSSTVFNLLVLLLMLAGLWEWRTLCAASLRSFGVGTMVLLFVFSLYSLDLLNHTICFGLFTLGVFAWLLNTIQLVKPVSQDQPLCLHKGVFFLGLAWLSMVSLRDQFGSHTLMLALLMIWSADTFAYFGGKRFGKTKLAPNISPGKTREGVTSGTIMAILVAVVYSYVFIVPSERLGHLFTLLIITILVALISVVGDLFESKLKRAAGMKDSGNLIPGHGGILDRIDGLIAGIVVYAFYAYIMRALI